MKNIANGWDSGEEVKEASPDKLPPEAERAECEVQLSFLPPRFGMNKNKNEIQEGFCLVRQYVLIQAD